jgi:hypothetical protein
LEIAYRTFKYAGEFNKSVTIFTGTDGKDETVIHLIGRVDPIPMGVIRVEPRKTDVGVLAVNKDNKVQMVIENIGDAPLKISKIVSTSSKTVYFDAEKAGEMVLDAGERRALKLTLKPVVPGRILDTILIFSDARNDIGKGYKALLAGEAR